MGKTKAAQKYIKGTEPPSIKEIDELATMYADRI